MFWFIAYLKESNKQKTIESNYFDKKGLKNLCSLKFVLNLHSLNGSGIGLWCNGNTTVFGAVFQGSSPCRPTKVSQ